MKAGHPLRMLGGLLAVAACCGGLNGCASVTGMVRPVPSEDRYEKLLKNANLEVKAYLAGLASESTGVDIPPAGADEAWARARTFIDWYSVMGLSIATDSMLDTVEPPRYGSVVGYHVTRRWSDGQVRIAVEGRVRKSGRFGEDAALRNARICARYIRTGECAFPALIYGVEGDSSPAPAHPSLPAFPSGFASAPPQSSATAPIPSATSAAIAAVPAAQPADPLANVRTAPTPSRLIAVPRVEAEQVANRLLTEEARLNLAATHLRSAARYELYSVGITMAGVAGAAAMAKSNPGASVGIAGGASVVGVILHLVGATHLGRAGDALSPSSPEYSRKPGPPGNDPRSVNPEIERASHSEPVPGF